jgi:hypothetical protein
MFAASSTWFSQEQLIETEPQHSFNCSVTNQAIYYQGRQDQGYITTNSQSVSQYVLVF